MIYELYLHRVICGDRLCFFSLSNLCRAESLVMVYQQYNEEYILMNDVL